MNISELSSPTTVAGSTPQAQASGDLQNLMRWRPQPPIVGFPIIGRIQPQPIFNSGSFVLTMMDKMMEFFRSMMSQIFSGGNMQLFNQGAGKTDLGSTALPSTPVTPAPTTPTPAQPGVTAPVAPAPAMPKVGEAVESAASTATQPSKQEPSLFDSLGDLGKVFDRVGTFLDQLSTALNGLIGKGKKTRRRGRRLQQIAKGLTGILTSTVLDTKLKGALK